jgi:hypothetical protein
VNSSPQISHRMPVMLIFCGSPRSRILRAGSHEHCSTTPLREDRSALTCSVGSHLDSARSSAARAFKGFS